MAKKRKHELSLPTSRVVSFCPLRGQGKFQVIFSKTNKINWVAWAYRAGAIISSFILAHDLTFPFDVEFHFPDKVNNTGIEAL